MLLIKSIWLALVDVFNMFKLSHKLVAELLVALAHVFMGLMGIASLILSVVLFPFIVYRKYKNLKPKKVKSKKLVKKFGMVRV
nr:MAG TPA: hypothetical protein [Caudoviricetes sp.]